MSIVTTFPFDNTANYTKVNTEVSGGAGRLALVPKSSQLFNQPFTSDAGFTYDNLKTEFIAGVMRQVNQRPALATAGAKFNIDTNFNWGNGDLTLQSVVGTPVINAGKLDLNLSRVLYDATGKINPNKGSIKWKYTHRYNGNPTITTQHLDYSNISGSNQNRFVVQQGTASDWRVYAYNSAGTIVLNNQGFGTKVLTLDQEYILEWRYDYTIGSERQELFIDGVQQGGTFNKIATMDNNLTSVTHFRIGGAVANFSIRDVLLTEDDAQDENYVIAEADYLADTVDMPDFNYSLQGTIQSLDTLATVETNAPKYTFEGQYWNGLAWATSDGSFAQANDKATAIANLPTLDMTGQTAVSVQVVWDTSNNQMSVDDLNLTYTGQEYPLEGTLLTNNAFVANDINSFVVAEVTPLNTSVFYAIEVGGVCMYWDGAAWVISNCTSAQANTLADIQANIGTLLTANSSVKILVVLATTDQDASTPEVDIVTVNYDFGAFEPSDPNQCQVYGFLKDSENMPVVGATVTAVPNRSDDEYKEAANRVIATTISKTTDANGFFSMNLIISDDFEVGGVQKMRYVLSIAIVGQALPIFKNGTLNANQILFEVPNLASVNITDQIGAV